MWYVCSVNGDDASSGRSPNKPLKTLAALQAKPELGDNQILFLERGSVWREEFDRPDLDNFKIRARGEGRLPRIYADEIYLIWIKTVGRTNIYEVSVPTPTGEAGKQYLTAYEDDVLLTRVDSVDTVDLAPGSFYHGATNPGGNTKVFIHTSGSTDPNSNSSVYSISTRASCVKLGENCTIDSVWMRRPVNNNGCLEIGSNCLIEDCVFEDTHIHALLFGPGIIRRNWGYGFDPNIPSGAVVFEGYSTADSQGDCLVEDNIILNKQPGATPPSKTAGFYVHGQSGNDFGAVTYQRNQVYYLNAFCAGAGDLTGNLITKQNLAYECNQFGGGGGNAPFQSIEDELYRSLPPHPGIFDHAFRGQTNYPVVVDKFKAYLSEGDFFRIIGSSIPVDLKITNSIIALDRTGSRGGAIGFESGNNQVDDIKLTIDNNVFINWEGYATSVRNIPPSISDLTNYSSDSNVYQGTSTRFNMQGTEYQNYDSYRAAYPALDINSQAGSDAGITDIANRDYSKVPGGLADLVGAGDVKSTIHTKSYAELMAEVVAL